ncbi:Inositol-pentakisphosphate 2-kinase [Varanus komodoensis]|nr:Inositol-pentakisphosphate 2-kinase [Varanus komodoensis]
MVGGLIPSSGVLSLDLRPGNLMNLVARVGMNPRGICRSKQAKLQGSLRVLMRLRWYSQQLSSRTGVTAQRLLQVAQKAPLLHSSHMGLHSLWALQDQLSSTSGAAAQTAAMHGTEEGSCFCSMWRLLPGEHLMNAGDACHDLDSGLLQSRVESGELIPGNQPKCGFLPFSSYVSQEIKYKVCRYCMHQHLKVAKGKWKRLSKYCPLDLFSGKRQRKEKGVQLLSVDGKMITDDEKRAEVLSSYFGSAFSQKKF